MVGKGSGQERVSQRGSRTSGRAKGIVPAKPLVLRGRAGRLLAEAGLGRLHRVSPDTRLLAFIQEPQQR